MVVLGEDLAAMVVLGEDLAAFKTASVRFSRTKGYPCRSFPPYPVSVFRNRIECLLASIGHSIFPGEAGKGNSTANGCLSNSLDLMQAEMTIKEKWRRHVYTPSP